MALDGQRAHVVVVGGGIGGLAAALTLARAGNRVTLLERDVIDTAATPDDAFFAQRRGAPQVHQTHAFLARTVVTLRDRLPDVLAALRRAGAGTTPANQRLGEPQPGDGDLALLVVRRTTYEWVLRNTVLAERGAAVRAGAGATGLLTAAPSPGRPATVTGVVLDDATELAADAVVVATGRRGDLPGWLARVGVEVDETVHESELMYFSRWYRRPAGSAPAPELRGVDSGFVKYLAVPGDADTLSITLAIRPDDRQLRAALAEPERFDAACAALPGPNQFFAEGLQPLTDVRPMGGLINRLRRFTDADGEPLVLGVHAVGDAHTCTNPIYGRGCSLALVQAMLLADSFADHPGDRAARARQYEAASTREIEPWFHTSVQWDEASRLTEEARQPGDRTPNPVQALFIAAKDNPVLARGLSRLFNLLVTPERLFADPEFTAQALDVMGRPADYPFPDREGPSRSELLALLAPAERTAS